MIHVDIIQTDLIAEGTAVKSMAAKVVIKIKKMPGRVIRFYDYTDECYQAIECTGQTVIIINNPTIDQANKIADKLESFRLLDVSEVTALESVVAYAGNNLGLKDRCITTADRVKKHLIPSTEKSAPFIYMKRNGAVMKATYIPHAFNLTGKAKTPQQFIDNGVLLTTDKSLRGCQTDVFLKTYVMSDGSKIESIDQIVSQELV